MTRPPDGPKHVPPPPPLKRIEPLRINLQIGTSQLEAALKRAKEAVENGYRAASETPNRKPPQGGSGTALPFAAGKPSPTVDPLPVLMRLLKAGSDATDSIGTVCHYCRGEMCSSGIDHAPDCPYVEAITLFGDPNATDAPRGILKA